MFPSQGIEHESLACQTGNFVYSTQLPKPDYDLYQVSHDQDLETYISNGSPVLSLTDVTYMKVDYDLSTTEEIAESGIVSAQCLDTSLECYSSEQTSPQFCDVVKVELTAKTMLSCKKCKYTTHVDSLLRKHKKSHLIARQYRCEECNYTATDSFRIKRHLSSHRTERHHKCTTCQSVFKNKETLQAHEKIHTGDKPHKCMYCDYAALRSTSLKLHLRTHTGEKPYLCLYCGLRSAHQSHFRLHLMSVHFNLKPHKCDLCKYSTSEAAKLRKHMQTHKPREPRIFEPGQKEHQCKQCTFATSRVSSLNRHVKIHTGEKPFVCGDCGHATAYKSHLSLHQMRFHLGLRPHKCTLCNYSTSTNCQLQGHMITHNKQMAVKQERS